MLAYPAGLCFLQEREGGGARVSVSGVRAVAPPSTQGPPGNTSQSSSRGSLEHTTPQSTYTAGGTTIRVCDHKK